MNNIEKTYGTVLRNIPQVNDQYHQFQSLYTNFQSPISLPKNFDGRKVWGNYLSPIRDQKKCGNCFSISTVDMLADRYALLTLGQVKVQLSATEMTLCDYDLVNLDAYKKAFQTMQAAAKVNQIAHANSA